MMEGYSYNDYDIPVPLSQRSLGSCFGKASYVWNSHHHMFFIFFLFFFYFIFILFFFIFFLVFFLCE